jgi:two-component system NtrC family sensor kinase
MREHQLLQCNVALQLELHPAAMAIVVNREEIQQVVLNLLVNAEHALGDAPGTIVMRTRTAGGMHVLQVVDEGPGISAELRGRVFEPFFTTKEVGQGTGLGLSIALGIAKAHGGLLELCPSVKGACFQLTLPAAMAPVKASEAPPVAASTAAPAGTVAAAGRGALVIEDEAHIRTMLARLLAKRGYSVTEATSLAEATHASAARTFDLVLCDVRLADANGADCLRRLRQTQPDVDRRFVFVTGDIGALGEAAREFGAIPVLPKPFTTTDLDRVLADVEVGV